MAFVRNGVFTEAPKVSPDYYLAGSKTKAFGLREREPFRSREEKYLHAEYHFPDVYKEEWGNELSPTVSGLVVIQQGHYPLDFDIAINPTLKHHCAKQAIMINTKVMHQPYTFVLRTYWHCAGSKRLERLLDSSEALLMCSCAEAVARYVKFKEEALSSLYMGVQLCVARKFEHPYRVWRLQREDLSVIYLLVSLLNGAMFELLPQELPEMREAPAEFQVGVVQFKEESAGNYFRG